MRKFEIKLGSVDFIRVHVTNGNGALVSSLGEDAPNRQYETAIDGLESLILAHACAGVNIEDEAYVAGIESAVEKIVEQY